MANLNAYQDVIQSCDTLLQNHFTKFHIYTKHQEELRLKFITTNDKYKILKTWLHIAYEDIITLKSEHGDLIKFYETLLSSNFVNGFLKYANDQETLQFKFVEKMNEYKSIMKRMNAAKENITSLKTIYSSLTRSYEIAPDNYPVEEFLNSAEHQETMRSSFIETLDECKCLKTSLDLAHEEILVLDSELDEVTKHYEVLSKNKNVKDFLDYARKLETNGFKFIDVSSNQCKSSKECTNRAPQSNTVDELNFPSNVEMNSLESEVDSGLSIKRERHTSYFSENDENPALVAEGMPSEFNIKEINFDNRIKDELQPLYLSKNSDDVVAHKQETPDEQCLTVSTPATQFETVDLFEEKSVIMEFLPETVEDCNSFLKSSIPNESCILEPHRNQSLENIRKQNFTVGSHLIEALFHRRFECVTCGKSFPKKNALIAHIRSHKDKKSFHCDKCGKSFKMENNQQNPLKCPVCDVVNQNNSCYKMRRKLPHEFFSPRCDICGRTYSSVDNLKEHIFNVHDGQKPFKCCTCNKLFARKGDLKKHSLSHYSLPQKFFS